MFGTLFDPSPDFNRSALAARLADLAAGHLYVGTSSWKYEGWLGQIYTPANYTARGRFSKRQFEEECLREYATVFPTVCGDFAFYQFPSEAFWRRLFAKAPEEFRFAFKVPEQITCRIWPEHTRYGAMGGMENASFLDADLLTDAFLRPLEPFAERIGVLIFEFGAFPARAFRTGAEFGAALAPFLARLPRRFRYAVEIRNADFLEPVYFDCLRSHNVAHVFNAWARMPELTTQMAHPDAFTADFVVSRALLKRGRAYENAVELFQPYDRIQEPLPEVRQALRTLLELSRQRRMQAYIYVNNRLEGNAPGTIEAIIAD